MILTNYIMAFIICGVFCGVGQIILDNSKLTPGHITSMFVVLGSILEFFNLYTYIRQIGHIGASLPISSFGSVIMKGVKEMIDKDGMIGIFTGVFNSSGGIIAFAVFLSFIASVFFKPKS